MLNKIDGSAKKLIKVLEKYSDTRIYRGENFEFDNPEDFSLISLEYTDKIMIHGKILEKVFGEEIETFLDTDSYHLFYVENGRIPEYLKQNSLVIEDDIDNNGQFLSLLNSEISDKKISILNREEKVSYLLDHLVKTICDINFIDKNSKVFIMPDLILAYTERYFVKSSNYGNLKLSIVRDSVYLENIDCNVIFNMSEISGNTAIRLEDGNYRAIEEKDYENLRDVLVEKLENKVDWEELKNEY